jgi:hypothetical protein
MYVFPSRPHLCCYLSLYFLFVWLDKKQEPTLRYTRSYLFQLSGPRLLSSTLSAIATQNTLFLRGSPQEIPSHHICILFTFLYLLTSTNACESLLSSLGNLRFLNACCKLVLDLPAGARCAPAVSSGLLLTFSHPDFIPVTLCSAAVLCVDVDMICSRPRITHSHLTGRVCPLCMTDFISSGILS